MFTCTLEYCSILYIIITDVLKRFDYALIRRTKITRRVLISGTFVVFDDFVVVAIGYFIKNIY